MWLRWLPWRFLLSRLARAHGFIDPVAVLSRLHRIAQPSEVTEPIELLRAGMIFHARGLINARTIQHNLDWIWPFWVERQFNPRDPAFIPRAFSVTHVNLTHRNWTAVGLPDCDRLPVVDPRGLVTPLFDGWSLDAWVLPEGGRRLLPSRAERAVQRLILDDPLAVETFVHQDGVSLFTRADVVWQDSRPWCRLRARARSGGDGWLALAVRPANPEGVSFVHTIRLIDDRRALQVNDEGRVHLSAAPARVCMSPYRRGDVLLRLEQEEEHREVTCDVGLASAAALYPLGPEHETEVEALVSLANDSPPSAGTRAAEPAEQPPSWEQALEGRCRFKAPDARAEFLFEAAARTLVLHAPGEVYPGPYTYRRFWFRDAAFILEGLLALGRFGRVRRVLDRYPARQRHTGYFHSQDGEWDSNGAALWALDRYRRLSGKPLPRALTAAVRRGADWVKRKRLPDTLDAAHAGLLPAGFSAEHLGPNDFYYWDDFWSAAGLRSAAAVAREAGDERAARWEEEADRLLAAVERSLERTAGLRDRPGVPAAPTRRLDAGAVGSLSAGYPLRLWPARDPRLLGTAEYLWQSCRVRGGFFQDMIHSGVNPYLTLHLAQVFLRAGDDRFWPLVRAVVDLASPTGQWPEAVHPQTGGGCMGDGQHVWAAAEWVLMMRSLFVREEGDGLVLASGIPDEWLASGEPMELGPAPTPFGPVSVEVVPQGDEVRVSWRAEWRGEPPRVEVALRGRVPVVAEAGQDSVAVRRESPAGNLSEAVP